MKEADRARITRALEDIDTWRASGTKLKDYVQTRGEQLSHWRARLSWEQRWRRMSDGAPTTRAFERAVAPTRANAPRSPKTGAQPSGQAQANGLCVRIPVSPEGSALRASIEWPLSAVGDSGTYERAGEFDPGRLGGRLWGRAGIDCAGAQGPGVACGRVPDHDIGTQGREDAWLRANAPRRS